MRVSSEPAFIAPCSANTASNWKRDAKLTRKQSAHAFKCPKIAAAAHEAGHIVVAATLGHIAKNAKLVETKNGSGIWGGVTNFPEHNNTPILDAETALLHARILYAGMAGEMFLKPEFIHEASSVDEVAMSQLVMKAFVVDDQNDAEKCWNEKVHYDVIARLRSNQSVLKEIGKKLFRQGQMRQPQLRKLTERVRTLS